MPRWTKISVRVSMEGGRLVEDQHRRVGHRRTRNGKQLALALGEVGAVAGQHRVEAIRQAADEQLRIGQAGRRTAFFVGGVQAAVADVVHDRTGKQVGILQNDAQRGTQVVLLDLLDIEAVIQDGALLDIVEAVDQVG